jgi:Monooxygenase af470-like
MKPAVNRQTVDLSAYPDLVVIYLGMRVNAWFGIKTLFGFGPKISGAVEAKPPGLLLHESLIYSLFPLHAGMRQYWQDFESLETWSRSEPHKLWWQNFLRDNGGTGFWHETYFRKGGIEAVYDNIPRPLGLMAFAPVVPARGAMFSARKRLKLAGEPSAPDPVSEDVA